MVFDQNGILFLPSLHLINQDIILFSLRSELFVKKIRNFFRPPHFFKAGDAADRVCEIRKFVREIRKRVSENTN